MAPLSIIGALSALPLALAHMQMSSPSPLRDPHANRPNEPKDYNILSPLNADGSNFACKGYHLNTPLTTVATYAAGSKQTLRLAGSATHGGGSCQISLSCDGGSNFNVLKSIMGGCPLTDSYDFTVPSDIPAAKKCLLAWTWFNRIGNREMYMNCAVVDITNKSMGKRDSQAAAAQALLRYPDLFVANLASINSCKTQETTDVIFDTPGKQVAYGNGDNASMQPSFRKGQCTGKGSKNADSTDTSSSNSGGGQWTPPAQSTSQQSTSQQSGDCASKIRDGLWHPECYGSNTRTNQQQNSQQQPQQDQQEQEQQQQPQQSQQDPPESDTNKPNTKVQQELDAYLATLYGRSLARRNMVPAPESYNHKKEYLAQPAVLHPHTHTEDCKHKPTSYPPGSHYHNKEDLDPYPEDGIDYSNKDVYNTQDSQYQEDPDSAYKRTARQRRWRSYTKRADGTGTPIQFHRGDESAYYQQQASSQASTQASTQTSAQTSDDPPVQKSYYDMTPAEQFEAFLRRMVELSNNVASLIKYAAASTVNIPYYPPASTYNGTGASTMTYDGAGASTTASAQNAVQDLVKRQLVDPVTSGASADAGDSVNVFDALLSSFLKAFGGPSNILEDDSETDPVPAHESEPEPEILPLGEPDFYTDYPDFEVPDVDGHHMSPPHTLAPEPSVPEDPFDGNGESPLEAPDASGRHPRPGMSHPLIPYPLPENFTGPFPANETAPSPLLNATAPASNHTQPPVELQPYQNKTLGELISEIFNSTDSHGPSLAEDTPAEPSEDVAPGLTPVPSDSSDDLPPIDQPSQKTNPLQEAADQAGKGVTIPKEPVSIDPNALESIADALPWFMGPGPVVTNNVPADVDGTVGGSEGPQ